MILNAGNTGANYVWQDNSTAQTLAVNSSGTYWVNVTVNGCMKRDSIIVSYVAPIPSFSIGNDTTYCGAFSQELSTGVSATLWSTGVSTSSITVSTPGLYWAQESNICGSLRDSIIISDNPFPVVNLGNDTSACPGNEIILNAGNSGATYLWQDNTTAQTLTVNSAGTYWVNVTVNGCMKRDSIIVSYVAPIPSFSIGNDTTYCGAFSQELSTGVSATLWSTGVSTSSITVSTPGLYWAQESNICGSLRDSIIISDNPLPLVDLGNDTSVCPGNEIILNAGNPGATYLWQNNMTSQTLTVSSAGIYWVNVTVNGCSKQDSINVSSLSPPLPFSIGIDTTICEDSSLVLNAFQNNTKYFWSNGDTTAIITVNQSGKYFVIDSNSCGSYSASISVTTKPCVCRVAIPTAFSPNNDGRNDFFWVLTQCPLQNFQFDIYNRWGQKIFSTNNVMDKWDGTYRGMQQPLGVYVYFLKYRDPYTDKDISQTGDVTLLR